MTVRDLIKLLEKIENQDRVVVLETDQEGNDFAELEEVATAAFYEGEIGLEKLTEDLEEKGYCDEDLAPEDSQPAVVLWP